jgi:CheY-like chemotaxis protein
MKKLIICVDDEKIVLNSLQQQLQNRYGSQYSYEIAESAQEAMEIAEEVQSESADNIVLIISDWLMPGIKGDEFLIQFHQKYPKPITMMLTGQADKSAIDNAKNNANLFCCLKKPWKKEDLYAKIEEAFAQ